MSRSRIARRFFAGASLSTMLACCGCATHSQTGALMGAGMGSLAGAAIGSSSGNSGAGALIGGITGAMAGGVLGDAADARDERDMALVQRDAAIAQAKYVSQSQPVMTNFDLVRLAQSGVTDDVVINMIHTRGGQFDLSPDAVISLKSNGVGDRVIIAAQSAPTRSPSAGAPPDVVVVQPSPVYVEPPIVYYDPWGPFPHRHYRHRPRSGAHMHFRF